MKQATLWYVTPPTDEQLARLKAFLVREMGDEEVELTMEKDSSLVSGFVLRTDLKEYSFATRSVSFTAESPRRPSPTSKNALKNSNWPPVPWSTAS